MSADARAVVLEAYGAHGECLDFQVTALQRAGMQVEVWTGVENRWRSRDERVRHVVLSGPTCLAAAGRLWRAPPALLAINTATGPVIRDLLCLIRPLGIATVGIFHDAAKLRRQFSSRLIARLVHARLLLARHLADAAEASMPLDFSAVHLLCGKPDTSPGARTEFVIPGVFCTDKKDADALLAVLQDPELDPRIGFTLLGRFKDDPGASGWWQRCVAAGVTGRLRRFTGFVPCEEFAAHLGRCAGVLPLIHPTCGHYQRFRDDKVSGAINLALGAQVPLMIHVDLANSWRLGPVVHGYADHRELVRTLNRMTGAEWWGRQRQAIARSHEAQPLHQQAAYLQACARAALRAGRQVTARTGAFIATPPSARPRPKRFGPLRPVVAGGFH